MTVKLGVLALLEAKPGKGGELGAFLEAGRQLAAAEVGTVLWQHPQATVNDGRLCLSKAGEFLQASNDSLALGNRVAAAGNAVHAGIAAADAIAACRAGAVWKGEHSQAAGYLAALRVSYLDPSGAIISR